MCQSLYSVLEVKRLANTLVLMFLGVCRGDRSTSHTNKYKIMILVKLQRKTIQCYETMYPDHGV